MANKWNLVDLLSPEGSEDPLSGSIDRPEHASTPEDERKRRKFYLPLASIAPQLNDEVIKQSRDRIQNIVTDIFVPEDKESIPSDFPVFHIDIRLKAGQIFTDDGDFPDPLIRLHAVAEGFLTFKPATDTTRHCLALEILILQFRNIMQKVKWWDRWVEAECIPHTILYENVDREHLAGLLKKIQAPDDGSPQNRVPPTYGVSFPVEVTKNNKDEFIKQFLEGNDDTFLRVEAGAYIGKVAAKKLEGLNNPNADKHLSMKVTYHDHTSEQPHYMNPRELLHLLFGKDSYEKENHPLLKRIHAQGHSDIKAGKKKIEAKAMVLRPPLRTSARLEWEANQEIDNHGEAWGAQKPNGEFIRIDKDRFYNTRPPFFTGPYPPPEVEPASGNVNKCNLFALEVCLRSGFRVKVWRDTGSNLLFYKSPDPYFKTEIPDMSLARDIRRLNKYRSEGYAVLTSSNNVPWGRRWTKKILEIESPDSRCDELNSMIREEGRCFVLIKAKKGRRSGHIAIMHGVVKRNNHSPVWLEDYMLGLQIIRAAVYETTTRNAVDRTRDIFPVLPHIEGNELFLVELHPGKDPDTIMGLTDLCVT